MLLDAFHRALIQSSLRLARKKGCNNKMERMPLPNVPMEQGYRELLQLLNDHQKELFALELDLFV